MSQTLQKTTKSSSEDNQGILNTRQHNNIDR